METARNTQQFAVCSQVRMYGHRPTIAQWEPQESDPIVANGLYRRENNVPGSRGLHTVVGAGQNLMEGLDSTDPRQPPLQARVMQANQDAGLFAGHPQEGVAEEVGVRKPSFLP